MMYADAFTVGYCARLELIGWWHEFGAMFPFCGIAPAVPLDSAAVFDSRPVQAFWAKVAVNGLSSTFR